MIKRMGMKVAAATASVLLFGLGAVSSSQAGAKLTVNDDAYIDLGFRLQHLTMLTQTDSDGDGSWDSTIHHRLRRGRLRVKAVASPWFSAFIQTELGSGDGGSGQDMRVIDAFFTVKADRWAQFVVGQNMVPTNRQNVTSSGVLMAIDRPGTAYHNINWGNRSVYRFATSTVPGSRAGISSGDNAVRDVGVTLFGSGPVGEQTHLKYYVGTYNGVTAPGETSERIAARAQVNFFEAEGGYYNSSTYLGKKKTVALGASVDIQPKVVGYESGSGLGTTMVSTIDYSSISADAFTEWPVGENTLTAEVGMTLVRPRGQTRERAGNRLLGAGRLPRPAGLAALGRIRDVRQRRRR